MDWSHFEIARRPFRPAVDTGSYFPSAGHEAALATIASAYLRRDPVTLLDGLPGTGKSLVARLWMERLPAETPRVVLPNLKSPRSSDLLQAILFDLNLPYRDLTEQELRLAVTEHLLNQSTVLAIDEAQNLGPVALEELRLLGNIESQGGSALFLLLVAQPRIHDLLKHSESAGFAQRIGSQCRIEPLTLAESEAYIRHQLKVAERDPSDVMDGDAVTLLAEACQGIPRLLNRAATCAAELAASGEAEIIDIEAALEAIARMGLGAKEEAEEVVLLKHPGKPRKPKAKVLRKRSA